MNSKYYFLISFYILFVCFSMTVAGVATAVMWQQGITEDGKVLGVAETAEDVSYDPDFEIQPKFLPAAKDRQEKPFKKDKATDLQIDAGSGAVVDCSTGQVLYDNNSEKEVSIASISKLATAMIFLEFNPGWDELYQLTKEDLREGGKIYVRPGEAVKIKDLFYSSLVGSGNTETLSLVHATGKSEKEFVEIMNVRMKEMGLEKTNFKDPIGLDSSNVSTAVEVAQIARKALKDQAIADAATTVKYDFKTKAGRSVSVSNTDVLLRQYPRDGIVLLGGKTGYIDSAGYCFVGKFKNSANKEVISVVLGGRSKNSRFDYTNDLVKWAYDNYIWQ